MEFLFCTVRSDGSNGWLFAIFNMLALYSNNFLLTLPKMLLGGWFCISTFHWLMYFWYFSNVIGSLGPHFSAGRNAALTFSVHELPFCFTTATNAHNGNWTSPNAAIVHPIAVVFAGQRKKQRGNEFESNFECEVNWLYTVCRIWINIASIGQRFVRCKCVQQNGNHNGWS